MIFVAAYLGGPFCTLERVADHVEHVARVGGDDCVALGSDFDGFMPLPRGLRDAADLPRLTELLWRRGWRGAAPHRSCWAATRFATSRKRRLELAAFREGRENMALPAPRRRLH